MLRCFLPIHVYDIATSCPVAMILRSGKTPSGREVRGHLRRLVRAIRRHWLTTAIAIRGDGHYGRPEMMDWCEDNSVTYVFGLTGTKALPAKVAPTADHIRVVRALGDKDAVRGFAETNHAAKSWRQQPRVAARIEATRLGLDIRYVVTNIATGTPEWLYTELYCARGQAENLITLHKGQLASDRTSCRHPAANQMRLVLHTAAYWLMLTVQDAIPAAHRLARAEFATIRLRRSSSPFGSARPLPASASPSRRVRKPTCYAILRPRSSQLRLERRGRDYPTNPLLSLKHRRNVPNPYTSQWTRDPARRQPKTRRQPSPGE